ncbi:hypothetical protein SAMN04487846_2846 [Microbacterium sp. cf046]|uniref:DUF6603 domain-containing protein n=1 Tax=Microbacterium sp. cf046 TaxID=1761803 RepID=UPI0008DF159F|nr:DUF6603 domain-containing protein [Microbacterium sp. cf046]SFS14094.1 hypothetical protein SAMN04487846_2846 [Microbacterium sp. cf046]
MSERSWFQALVAKVVDFLAFAAESLSEDVTRSALISDLGGDPGRANGSIQLPEGTVKKLREYSEGPEPDAEADYEALTDVVTLLDAIASNVEVWWGGSDDQLDQIGQSLLDLLATNYVRQRHFRVFVLAELLSVVHEVSSSYGAGTNDAVRLWDAALAALHFLIDPGKTLRDLAPTGSDPAGTGGDLTTTGGIPVDAAVNGLARLGAAVLAILDAKEDYALIGDVLAGWDAPGMGNASVGEPEVLPTRADVISGQMTSISIVHDVEQPEGEPDLSSRAQATFALVPVDDQGLRVFLAFGGSQDLDAKITERWRFAFRLRSDGTTAVVIGLDPLSFAASGPAGAASFELAMGWTSQPDPATGRSFVLPRTTGIRLEIARMGFSFRLGTAGAEMRAELANAALIVDPKDADGLIARLLGGTPIRLPFSVTFGLSTGRGRFIEGGIPKSTSSADGTENSPLGGDGGSTLLAATVPLSRRIGPVTIHEVSLRIAEAPSGASASADIYTAETVISFSAQIGPVYFRLDQLGLALLIDNSVPRSERNLRFLDAHLDVAFPRAVTINVDTDIVSGGGVLFHDPRTGTYFGVFAVRLWKRLILKAIALIATRDPDGAKASSFIVIATVEGLNWQVGPVTIDGLGVLYASDRTFDENAVRAALPTGQLKHLLFPADPVRHAPEILAPLASFFPARRDSYLIGVLVRMTFGRPPKITLDLALIFQGGGAVSNRLIVLGRVSSILPDDRIRAIQLNLDAVGVFDPSEGTASLDAVLVDSKLCGRFPLTGSAALRRVRGSVGFALAVGGFHPDFRIPAGFPALKPITVALTAGDNPKLICQAYLGVTANTVQFGAEASLYAAACGFSISGAVGFDVLIHLFPPHFLAEFRAKVQLKRGSRNLFSVTVNGEVEGPLPLRIQGKATFEILWCDFSVSFEKTLVDTEGTITMPQVDAIGELRRTLNDPTNWQSEPPRAGQLMVTVRRDDRPGEVLLHPLGTLSVRQGVVPLNLERDIDRLGGSVPSGDRRFAITSATIGPNAQDATPVREQFAPAQFFDLTDDEALAAPSFEEMDAGVSFGAEGYAFPFDARVNAPFDYTEITIGPDGEPTEESEPQLLQGTLVIALAAFGAAALAPGRAESATRFTSVVRGDAPRVRSGGWAVADDTGPTDAGQRLTWVEARRRRTKAQVLVPATSRA